MFLLLIKVVLFVVAEFVIRPKVLNKISFLKRISITFVPMKDEEYFFREEVKKLKMFRALWRTIFILLLLRILIGLFLNQLDY